MHCILGIGVHCMYMFISTRRSSTCSGVGVDPFCCSLMLFIILLTAEIAAFTRTPTSRRISVIVIKDRAVNQSIPLTPPNNADLLFQLL